jgi:DNA polymerase III delta prime subunit
MDVRKVHAEIMENYNREQDEKFFDRLPIVPYMKKHRQAIESHQPGTCQWFLKHTLFTSWKNDPVPFLLLCQGIPGAGKTILTAMCIEELLKDFDKDTNTAYVYCDYRNQEKETVPVLLWSLLRQLMTPKYLIFPFVRNKCVEVCTRDRDTNSKIKEIASLIRILSSMSQKTYLFVDGVDEVVEFSPYGEDVRQRLLSELHGLSDTCRIFVTCRPHIRMDHLHPASRYKTIQIRAANDDISAYVTSSISDSKNLRDFVTKDPSLGSTITNTIQNRSYGV